MNPTPTPVPTPIEVFMHAAPAADWQVWAAFAPLIAAIIAAGIAVATLWQRSRADRKAEWWRRAQWALDASFSDNPVRSQLGLDVITDLADSAPGKDEARIIQIASADPLAAAAETLAEVHEAAAHAADAASRTAAAHGVELDTPVDTTVDNGSTDQGGRE